MTVRINKQKINLREKLTEFEDKVNFDEVVRGLGEYTGSVGIGTTAPVSELSVNDSDHTAAIQITSSDTHSARLYLGDQTRFFKGALVYNNSDESFAFWGHHESTQTAEHMRIDSDGSVLIGKVITDQNTIGTQISKTTGVRVTVDANICTLLNRTGSDGAIASFRRNGSEKGSISITENTTHFNTSSDYRLKTDVQPITGASDRLKALKPVNFEWISDGTRVDGFLAHEAQEVVPEAVAGTKDAMQTEEYEVTPAVYEDVIIPAVDEVVDEDGNVITEGQEERMEQRLVSEAVMGQREVPHYQGIDQSKLIPLLTAAIQEQQSIIEDLKSRIETLESK
jgi:hypothetical protein